MNGARRSPGWRAPLTCRSHLLPPLRAAGARAMSLDGVYDHDNIFAKILRGELPSARVFEDDHVYAFMDAFPQAKGHTLVIPKHSTARNLLEEEPEKLSTLVLGVQRVARAVRAALNPDGVMIFQTNGAPAGQTVFHLHVHILPRWAGESPLGKHASGKMADMDELNALAAQIAAQIV
jgi:histidine triad (HIT) family protein